MVWSGLTAPRSPAGCLLSLFRYPTHKCCSASPPSPPHSQAPPTLTSTAQIRISGREQLSRLSPPLFLPYSLPLSSPFPLRVFISLSPSLAIPSSSPSLHLPLASSAPLSLPLPQATHPRSWVRLRSRRAKVSKGGFTGVADRAGVLVGCGWQRGAGGEVVLRRGGSASWGATAANAGNTSCAALQQREHQLCLLES